MTKNSINLEDLKELIVHPKIGEILIQHKKITIFQLSEALEEQKISNMPIGRILITKGFIHENELVELLSLQDNIDKLLHDSYSELEKLNNVPSDK